ncbi:UDP-3-O-(3-hydroxymyristoyl)glucosamine N-acyltransferase [Flavitalea sp. BT771]|uniref:UDP-3-O-(3-hydroxymyristoyl)glucosamine N-acyltransferase n=1 Tax=Flavitalea sp. BT771 TaxID=3063329 RepID=UPI0026E1E14C|nr:UDP-3-O-(3-hydroxymyristoyl)glucosamine N-acyltransferase [Flavitalea sp. BT771]MDO6434272.1 UDP-3-O-(3-hydroxymyristoyl)glucosamine N-acyltransferase [Flavitalea sp. BT771]MDV6223172.1 UDP-3-O-(3-hydroxymyristoyl)glucosamine N-acyltransferase [Flavitalea sp. BT771]
MKFPSPVSVQWIADFLGAQLIGDKNGHATGINEIHKVEKGDLVFVDHPKYYDKCIRSAASYIIINQAVEQLPAGKALLVVEQPFEAYLKIVRHFRPFEPAVKMVSDSAVIGKNTYIAPGVFIGHHVVIGDDCIIHPHVTILDHCVIGNKVIIQAGTVIGSDAFYYNSKKDRELWYKKMESCGRVVLEDGVEIGANCTIDRGVSHDTRIGAGTKMDNLVHIGHDTVTGRNCLFAGQVGIAGAVEIGNGVILWGQVGVSKTLSIGDNSVVLAQSGVPASLEAGKVYFGTPVEEAAVKKRELVWIKRIPELWNRVMQG